MSWPTKAPVTWHEQVRTVSSVVSALCLLTLTVAIISAGVYTVNVVSTFEQHPNNLNSMMQNGKEAIESANHFLKSSQMDPLLRDFHDLIGVMSNLAGAIDELQVQKVLNEAEIWRNMSNHAMVKLAKTVLEL